MSHFHMNRCLAALIFLGMSHTTQSQSYSGNKTSGQHQKLIVNEYNPKHENYHCYVVAYYFRKGSFISKDTLFEAPRLFMAPIHLDRYLISSSGPIFDMATKKIIWESKHLHSFTEARGDTVFYVNTGTDPRNQPYHFLDLKSLAYAKDDNHHVNYHTYRTNSTLRFSPDNKKAVYPSQTKPSPGDRHIPRAPRFNIVLRDQDKGDRIIVRHINSASSFNVEFSRVAIFWLNNTSFLYDHHHFYQSADHKGYHDIEIRKYDLETESDRLLCRIDSAKQTNTPRGVFRRDAIGQLHYSAHNGIHYLLDTVSNTVSIDPFFYLNKDFSYNIPFGKGMTIRYRDRILIEQLLGMDPPVASDHSVAVIYRNDGPWVGHHNGIKIWTSLQNEWVTIDVPWPREIVGWTNE